MTKSLVKTPRPSLDMSQQLGSSEVRIPYYPLSPWTLYDVTMNSDILRTIINTLKTEIFRFGIETPEKFVKKCLECGTDYDVDLEQCRNEECLSADLASPNPEEKQSLERWISKANLNKQTLKAVLQNIEEDFNVIDDCYLMAVKDYSFALTGEVFDWDVSEIIHVSPLNVRIIADKRGYPGVGDNGLPILFCLAHRESVYNDGKTEFCPKDKYKLIKANFKTVYPSQKELYYSEDEIFHTSKYNPSLTYGYSLVFAVWTKVVILWNMDQYMKDLYSERRPPKGLMAIRSPNIESFEKSWAWAMDEFAKNPHMVLPFPVTGGEETRGKLLEYIDFMRSLDEMQFTEVRNELRRAIGANFGVMPLFQGDITTTGGLNNEGLQITVTNRAVEDGQAVYNEELFPWLLKQLKINDYELKLKPAEQKDEMTELKIQEQKIANAQRMKDLGVQVTLNEQMEFEFEPGEIIPQQFGGFGQDGFAQPAQAGAMNQPSRFTGEPEILQRAITTSAPSTYQARFSPKRVKEILTKFYLEKAREIYPVFKADDTFDERLDIISTSLFDKSFENMTQAESDKIKKILIEAIEKAWSIEETTSKVFQEMKKLTKEESERIVRTEIQSLQNKAREEAFIQSDPEENKLFKWSNPLDNRTSEICRKIVDITSDGVPLSELKSIIKEIGGEQSREWTPHVNCRSTMVRHFESKSKR